MPLAMSLSLKLHLFFVDVLVAHDPMESARTPRIVELKATPTVPKPLYRAAITPATSVP